MTISKYILTAVFSLTSVAVLLGCSCLTPPALCEYTKYLENKENQVIFIGTVVDEMPVDSFFGTAYKVAVETVIRGEISTGPTGHFYTTSLVNTLDEVWMLGGSSATCLRTLSGRMLIATEYDTVFFGYQPTICLNDAFAIDNNNNLSGFIWAQDEVATISIDDIDEVLNGQCTTGVDDFKKRLDRSLTIYPNPTADELILHKEDYLIGDLQFKIQNTIGQAVVEGKLGNYKVLSLEPLAAGVYVLTVYLDGLSYSRRIVKV